MLNSKILSQATMWLAVALMMGCGGSTSVPPNRAVPGTVVAFGTDAPLCDVESFFVTITSASLLPQSGGQSAPLITATAPATVDFARLSNFTNILSIASVTQEGLYNQLQMTLTNPQLTVLNTSANPPTVQNVPVTLTSSTITIPISPALTVTSAGTSAITLNFNLNKSLQVDNSGQVTGTVSPQITAATNTPAESTLGEATALYGVVQSLTMAVSGGSGSFGLALADGTGQTLTILSSSSTVFDGDGVTSFSNLTTGTFVEVDAIVNTSGQIIAQTWMPKSKSPPPARTGLPGKVIALTQDGSGNATAFTLLIDDESPDCSSAPYPAVRLLP